MIKARYLLRQFLLLLSAITLLLSTGVGIFADFVGPSAITIDGSFAEWGTTGSPATGVYPHQDMSNDTITDGSGFAGTAADLNYFWNAISTQLGGTTPVSSSNLIQNIYYRIDTFTTALISPGQLYNIQLNLGVAGANKADHLLQIWVNDTATPKVTMVMYSYNAPYPPMGAFTSGSLTGRVSNKANPYPGFSGVVDTSATGAYGLYDGTHYSIEVKIPINWFGSTYGGLIKNDGSGATTLYGVIFTSTGTLGSVGTVKDTIGNSAKSPIYIITDPVTGDTQETELKLVNIIATKTDSIFTDVLPTGAASPGDVLLYTVIIRNSGVSTARSVIFQDTITDPNLNWCDNVTTTAGTITKGNSPGDTGCTVSIGNMLVDATVTITFRAQIKSSLPTSVVRVVNQGTVSGSNFPSVATNDPRTVLQNDPTVTSVTPTDMVEPFKTWALTTDADGNGYPSPGDTLTYSVTVENEGTIAAENVVFTDIPDLNSTLLIGSVTTTRGTVTKGNSPGDKSVAVDIGSIPGGQLIPVTVTFSVIINSPLPAGVTQLINQGFASGSNFPSDPTDDPTDQAYDNPTITPLTAAPLIESFKRAELTDDADNDGMASVGDNLTYIITIVNKGNQAATGVTFGDTVDANTSLVVGTAFTSQGTITSETATGLALNIGTMPGNGYSVDISFKATITGAAGGVYNQGTVTADGGISVLTDDPNTHTLQDATFTAIAAGPAELRVTKSALLAIDADNNGVSSPGDTLQYIVAINNNGGSAATNVVYTDTLDIDTTLVLGSTTTSLAAVITETASSVTANIGTLEGGTAHSICLVTYRALIISPLANDTTTISNQGLVTADGSISVQTDDPNTASSPDATVITAYAHPLVTATKVDSIFTDADGNGAPSPGDTLLYTIFIANNGNSPAGSVVFYDAIADGNLILDDNVAAPPGGSVILGNTPGDSEVQVNIGDIAAGDNRTITFHARINSPVPSGILVVSNQGSVSGTNFTTVTTDNPHTTLENDATTTSISALALIEPYKTWTLTTDADHNGYPSPGDVITYTVIIENTGNQNGSNVVFTDIPDSNSTLVAGSVTTTLGTVARGNASGDLSVTVNLGTLPGNHGSATISFRVTVVNPLPHGITELSNQGFVSGSNFPSDPTDDPIDQSYDNPTVTPLTMSPLIETSKRYELVSDIAPIDGVPGPGDTISYTITIVNKGNQNAAGVNFSDIPCDNTTLNTGSVATSQGTVTLGNTGGDTAVGVNIGTIAGNGGTATVSFTVTVKDNGSTLVSNQGTVTGLNFTAALTDDPNTTQVGDSTETQLAGATDPALHVTKTVILFNDADRNRVPSPGDTLQYIVTINNTGNGAADNVIFNDTPDASTTLVAGSVISTLGTVLLGNIPGNSSVRVNIGTLGSGGINLVTYRVVIRSGLPLSINTISNQGTVTGSNFVPTLTGDPSTGYSDNATVITFLNYLPSTPIAPVAKPAQTLITTTPRGSTATRPWEQQVQYYPNLVVTSSNISTEQTKTGTPVTVDAIVTNKGNAAGSIYVSLYVNGQAESTRTVSLNSGGSTPVYFTYSTDIPGEYKISVNNQPAGVLSVKPDIDPNIIILFTSMLCILSSLLMALIMVWKRRQESDY